MTGRYDWIATGRMEEPRDDWSLARRLWMYVRPWWKMLLLSGFCMMGVAAATSASALIVKNILDDVLVKRDAVLLPIITGGIILIIVLKGVFSYAQSVLMGLVGGRIIKTLQDELYRHVVRLSYSFFAEVPVGTLISRIAGDVWNIQNAVTVAVTGAVKDLFSILGLIGVVFYQDWKLAAVSLTVGPLIFYSIAYFGSRMRRISHDTQVRAGEMSAQLQESLAGIRVVKAFGAEERESGRFQDLTRGLFDVNMRMMRVSSLSRPMMEIIGAVMLAGVILYGGSQVLGSRMSVGSFFSFITALMLMYEPIKRLNSVNNTLQMGLASAERVFSILDLPPEITDAPGASELPRVRGEVAFEGVFFRYHDRDVLSGIDLTVAPGETVALVGTSGGGKTTLVNLIPRFYDVTAGRVTVDRRDVRSVTQASLRANIAIVAQETILFNDTVRSNIAYGKPGAGDTLVEAAARAAYIHDAVMGMPRGYDTFVGTSGLKLSGGQRQRIAIARALLKDAPILILDEATSSLDSESELLVQKALENLMRGRTTFVIAHRLSTVRNVDRILVVSGGRIVEEGNHEELLALGGEYAAFHRMQFREDRPPGGDTGEAP